MSDKVVETVAAPWFPRGAARTPVLNPWLRALGATIGRGVWWETYWLPESDLVTLERGATVAPWLPSGKKRAERRSPKTPEDTAA